MKGLRHLADLDLGDGAEVGSKAAVLGALLRRGLPVPDGFVVVDASRWRGASPLESATGFIARSSAAVEDGSAASFAGQFESLGGLRTKAAVRTAVRRISQPGARARAYAARLGLPLPSRIPVLVQRQVTVTRAGVLFTVDPLGQDPEAFAIGWGGPSAVTDGREGQFRRFGPLAAHAAASFADPVVARALPELVEHAFAALGILSRDEPLDLEWVVDTGGRLWVVQARPVTTKGLRGNEAVERLVSEGYLLVSPRPPSRLAQHHYVTAAEVDRRAAAFHHAHFERRIEGGWLLARRVKTSSRKKIDAGSPLAFGARFLWHRRRNLAFALTYLSEWALASRVTTGWAERLLATDLRDASGRRVDRLLADALRTYDRVRRVHAALWYPVDLAKDLASFESRFGWPGLFASLPSPARRTSRDRETAQLVLQIRQGHQGATPRWSTLSPAERKTVLGHLARHPYAFGSAAEVQDLAGWSSWIEQPERWWAAQSAAKSAELERLALASSRRPASPPAPASPLTRLVGGALWQVAARFAPLKDDRVELLALAASALRHVLVEIERRAGTSEADRGWVFELEPAELLSLRTRPQLKLTAVARLRRRLLAGFSVPRPVETLAQAIRQSDGPGDELVGLALSGGTASGQARVVRTADEARRFLRSGEVLVTEEIRPAFTAVLPRACALVCRRGTPLSHAAIVARELSIPAVSFEEVNRIQNGAALLVDGDRGRLRLLAPPSAGSPT
ncbi:MAG TPA: PEP/pyruvate-binding domain-containing protein [Myxococcales bacterium]|jgi:pyruvate,water dikinase